MRRFVILLLFAGALFGCASNSKITSSTTDTHRDVAAERDQFECITASAAKLYFRRGQHREHTRDWARSECTHDNETPQCPARAYCTEMNFNPAEAKIICKNGSQIGLGRNHEEAVDSLNYNQILKNGLVGFEDSLPNTCVKKNSWPYL